MTGTVTELVRHPIKSIGRELLPSVQLEEGRTMPWDRTWAIVHEASEICRETRGWRPVQNFTVTARTPGLAAIEASVDALSGRVALSHRELGKLDIDPDDERDGKRLVDWIRPLVPVGRAQPVGVYRAGDRGLTDTEFPSVSINSRASLSELSGIAGQDISLHRWRGNIWVEGFAPREEFTWVGKTIGIGKAELEVVDTIQRCEATAADPETGQRNLATLELLERSWGHRDFGVYARVIRTGRVSVGDTVAIAG